MINQKDFIYLDQNTDPKRVRIFDGRRYQFDFNTQEKLWTLGRRVQEDELPELLKLAMRADCANQYEYGLPFLPCSQMQMFEASGPYFNECLITPENDGKVHTGIFEIEQSDKEHPEDPKQVFRTMVWRFIAKLPDEVVNSLTPEKIPLLIQKAKAMPNGVFHLN